MIGRELKENIYHNKGIDYAIGSCHNQEGVIATSMIYSQAV